VKTIPQPDEPRTADQPSRVTLPVGRLAHDWRAAMVRARTYAAALGASLGEATAVGTDAIARAASAASWKNGSATAETLDAVRTLLRERRPSGAEADDPEAEWRLALWLRRGGASPVAQDADAETPSDTLAAGPTLSRGAMPAHPFGGSQRKKKQKERPARQPRPWRMSARRRRLLLGALVILPSIGASVLMSWVLPRHATSGLELIIAVFFGLLFAWISLGLWTAVMGFVVLWRRKDRYAVSAGSEEPLPGEPGSLPKTAVIMPICDEPVGRVLAGLRAIGRSIKDTGASERFDLFILSDTTDPDLAIAEEETWAQWRREEPNGPRVFYRRRRVRVRRKSGNVGDFCRRWGKQYRYMICLDADSVMSGETLVRLVRIMERRPDAAAVQTVPFAVKRVSTFGRVQQFTSRLYGPMFSAGLHFWQLGDGQYWGHNAIIRVQPFMEYCGLGKLPGKPPFGGEILSHDFVEAALLGRAGYTLWLAYDLPGSYEETPSSLLQEMQRDRRWCQGNLQHLRLLFTRGLYGAHRALFLNGALSYLSALLWLMFLILSTAEAMMGVLWEPVYFPQDGSLYPTWPEWRPERAIALFCGTAVVLFLPKILGMLLALRDRWAKDFGGIRGLFGSVGLEVILSALLAPIRMAFHTRFVVTNLVGRTVIWRSPPRDERETSWGEAVRYHGVDTLIGSAWALSVHWMNPQYFWWLVPVVGALILSIPVSVLASRIRIGEFLRRWRIFVTPEELVPPKEIQTMDALLAVAPADYRKPDGFTRAVVDPTTNALHQHLLRGPRRLAPEIRAARRASAERALALGPDVLTPRERRTLMLDAGALDDLHRRVWALDDVHAAARWGLGTETGSDRGS